MNYVPRGREQQQRANILRQILCKRIKKFGRNKGNIGDGGNPTKTKDQTEIKLVSSTGWTMEEQGARRVELVGLNDK